MRSWKLQPVAYMTTILTILTAVETVNETSAHFIPDRYNVYVLGAIGVLTVVLGVLTRNRVTPTAAPKDDAGTPLVPQTFVRR